MSLFVEQHYPLISIALCTYNGEKYLNEQLESLAGQSYSNYEIVIVDDNSSDNTLNILNEFIYKYKDLNIKLYKNKQNKGFTKNFEYAIEMCEGELIALADQDDLWMSNKLLVQYHNIGEHMLIYHDSLFINSDGKSLNIKASDIFQMHNNQSNLDFLCVNRVSGHEILFRRELLKYALPFDSRFYHDWWLAFVASNFNKMKYIPDILVYYRQHLSNVTSPLLEQGSGKIFDVNYDWLEYVSKWKWLSNKKEIDYIYSLFMRRKKKQKGMRYFVFLFRYYPQIIDRRILRKSILSRLNFTRKIYYKDKG